MKALLTAGGRGTRLRPITHTQNKHLIPIANKPILQYAIDAVKQAGITEIGIVVGVDNGHEVERAFGDGSQQGVAITYIWQEAPLGLAHVVKISQEFIGDDSFVFYLGDNIVVGGIERFVEQFNNSASDCLLTLARVRDPERFGVPEFNDEGAIVGVIEKPTSPKRLELLKGLLDTDGNIKKNGEVNFTTTSKKLADDISEIVYSLGGKTHVCIRDRVNEVNKRVDNRDIITRRISYQIGISFSE